MVKYDGVDIAGKEHVVANDCLGVKKGGRNDSTYAHCIVTRYEFLPRNLSYALLDFSRIGNDKGADANSSTFCELNQQQDKYQRDVNNKSSSKTAPSPLSMYPSL